MNVSLEIAKLDNAYEFCSHEFDGLKVEIAEFQETGSCEEKTNPELSKAELQVARQRQVNAEDSREVLPPEYRDRSEGAKNMTLAFYFTWTDKLKIIDTEPETGVEEGRRAYQRLIREHEYNYVGLRRHSMRERGKLSSSGRRTWSPRCSG